MTGIQTMRVGLLTPPFAGIQFIGSAMAAAATVGLPAGTQENDLVIAWGTARSTPSGYTEIANHNTSSGPAYYRKFMGVSPDANVTITAAEVIACAVFRNVDLTTPIDAQSAPTGSDNPPSVTTVTDNAMLLALGSYVFTFGEYVAQPVGYTEMTGSGTDAGDGNHAIFGAYLLAGAAGLYDPGAFDTAGDEPRSITIALRPAA